MIIYTDATRDLPEAWFSCIRRAFNDGRRYVVEKGSYEGQYRLEIPFITLRIANPGNRPLVPIPPDGIPAPTDMDYIERYLHYLLTDEKASKEEYTYGTDLALQVPEAIRKYREEGFGQNQVCMAVGDKNSIFLESPQCLRLVDTRIQDGKLHFIVYFRSWDLWGGFPSNMGGLQLVKEFMAREIGVEDGELIALSKGLHLYEMQWEYARAYAFGGQDVG